MISLGELIVGGNQFKLCTNEKETKSKLLNIRLGVELGFLIILCVVIILKFISWPTTVCFYSFFISGEALNEWNHRINFTSMYVYDCGVIETRSLPVSTHKFVACCKSQPHPLLTHNFTRTRKFRETLSGLYATTFLKDTHHFWDAYYTIIS